MNEGISMKEEEFTIIQDYCCNEIDRRKFLLILTSSLFAFFTKPLSLLPAESTTLEDKLIDNDKNLCPKLRDCIFLEEFDTETHIFYRESNEHSVKVGTANPSAGKLLKALNGKNSIIDLEAILDKYYKNIYTKEKIITDIVYFCIHLGQAGLLTSQFYVNLYRSEVICETKLTE